MEAENLSILIAFGAGLLSFLSPCVLPLVPAYVSHMAGTSIRQYTSSDRLVTFLHALAFVVGFSTVFVTFWVSIGLIGFLVQDAMRYIRQGGGVILVLMGLNLMGIIKIPFLYRDMHVEIRQRERPSYPVSFMIGVLFAAGWTPCIGPTLGAIIGLATYSETVWNGAYLLIAYSAGLGIPFLGTALALGTASGYLRRINRYMPVISIVSGIFLIVVGILMLTNMFIIIPKYFNWGAI
ncbi:MAG: cytochrome c biogenesis protein CcdA [Chloroflexota bacterium]|nr:MAG: cytochrome c biogenesis protein CcdA [Chloroflexota bacterium]